MTPERVISALAADPALAWLVARHLRVLGTWEPLGTNGNLCRWDPWRRTRVTLRAGPGGDGGGTTWWVHYFDIEDQVREVEVGGGGTDQEVVIDRADGVLQAAGYILVDNSG